MAPPSYGTLNTLDTLASSQQTIAQIGEDNAFQAINDALAAHNRIVQSMMADFVTTTTDRLRRFGSPAQMRMVRVDEYGAADAQKIKAGVIVGFPLNLYAITIQWTRKFLQNMRGEELAAQFTASLDADVQAIILAIKQALFAPFNYTSEDELVDHLQQIPLPIKALVNADGLPIPLGPNGEVFDPNTHTHYLASDFTVVTDNTARSVVVKSLIRTVVEHFVGGSPLLYINLSEEDTIRNLPGFVPYVDQRVVSPTTAFAPGANAPNLDPVQINNRAIGIFAQAEVRVKPWMPPGYLYSWVQGQPVPLLMRVRDAGSNNLILAAEDEDHPLRARQFEREFGIGVWNRTNGAILYIGGASYTVPALTA